MPTTAPTGEWPWIAHELGPERRLVAVLLALSALEIALRMLLPWPLTTLIDAIGAGHGLSGPAAAALSPLLWVASALTGEPGATLLVALVAAGLLIQLLHQTILLVHTRAQARLGLRLVRKVRERLFNHLQAIALVYHDRQPTGDAVYRLEADAACIEQIVLRALFPLTFSILTLLTMLAVLTAVDWRLALASMGVVPALLIWMRSRTRRMVPRARAAREAESAMVSQVYENIASIRLVKSYGRERHEGGRFSRAAGAVMEARLRSVHQDAVYAFGIGVLTAAGTAVVLALGGVYVIDGTSTPGTLLLALTYLGFVYGPLSGIVSTTGTMQQARVSAQRVHETLRIPREDRDRPGAIDPPRLAGRIVFDTVSFAFDDGRVVLRDISFEASPGQLVALVGPSGSGKTTLASLIPRFREATGGRVLVDGLDVRDYRLAALRRQVAIVLQDVVVLTGSVAENLRYGRLEATDADIEEAAKLAGAHEFIVTLEQGYRTPLPEAGRRLSGGQKQRLSLARAFLKDAPIVILDEPTAALDTRSERRVVEALHRLREGRTVIVIAHRLSTVREADAILVLDAGHLVAIGRHEELMQRSPLYRELGKTMVE